MKHLKKFLALLLSFCLATGLLPGAAAADGRAGRTVDVGNESALRQALGNAQDGDTIRLMASIVYRNLESVESNDAPLVIPKNITIDGNGNSLILWWGGIVLGADAELRNMSLSLPNSVYYSICANGYSLTLDNVIHDVSAHEISVFCGSMEQAGYALPESGSGGTIRIKGNTVVENLYTGSLFPRDHVAVTPAYQALSTIIIESGASGKVGDIHNCGAAKVGYGRQTPTPDAQRYPYKGPSPEISLYGNVARYVYGWTANRPKVTLSDSTGNLMSPTLYNVQSVSAESGNFELAAGSYFPEDAHMSISNGARLSLGKLFDSVTVGDFTGGGTLVLGRSQTLNVNGTISDTSHVAIDGVGNNGNSSTSAPYPNRVYIRGDATADESSFMLLPPVNATDAKFEFDSGEWSGPVVENIAPVLKSLSIKSEHKAIASESIVIPLYAQYVDNGASLQMLSGITLGISLNEKECVYDANEEVYTISLAEDTLTRFFPTLEDNSLEEVLTIETYTKNSALPDVPIPEGDYKIKITVPAESSASGQEFSVSFVLKVVAEGSTIAIPVPEGKTLVYNGQEQIGVEAGSGYTLGDTVSATNVGTYTATATLEADYIWDDNSNDVKSILWSIKAVPTKQSPPSGLSTLPPESAAGKGKIVGTTTDMEYTEAPASETSTWTACTAIVADEDSAGYTEAAPGTYAVRYGANEEKNLLASEAVEVTVAAYIAPEKPAAPTGLTAVPPETAGGVGAIEGTDAEMEYAAKGDYSSAEEIPVEEWIPCFGETIAVIPGTYYVRVKADPSKNRLTGEAAGITVPEPGQTIPEAPEGLHGEAPETADGMGKILGTTAEMEYAAKGSYASAEDVPADEWKDCTADATAAAPGTYYVRVKADTSKNQLAGKAAEVTIEPFESTPPQEAPSDLRGEAPEAQNGMGKIVGTTAKMEYVLSSMQDPADTQWTTCGEGETIVPPGTYLVRYKAENNRPASESTEVEVPEFSGEEFPDTPGMPPEGLTTEAPETEGGKGKILGTTEEMEYSTDGIHWTDCDDEATEVEPGKYLVRLKATGDQPASTSATVYVPEFGQEPPTVQEKPEGLTTEAPETEDGKGKILGTTDQMEYSSDGIHWTDCDNEATEVEPGVYYVRLKADPEHNLAAGEPEQVTVHTYASTLYPVMVVGSAAAENGTGSYRPGDIVKIDAGTREGFTFTGWTGEGDIAFENAGSAQTTFVMPEASVTVTANWEEGTVTPPAPPEPSIPSRPSGGNSHPSRPSGSRPSSGGSSKPEVTEKPSKPKPTETPEEPAPQNPFAPQPGSNPAAGWENPYRDVDSGEWYYTAVAYTTSQGLMSGTGSGSFSPSAVMTRGQLVTILYRLAGSPAADGSLRFPDTDSTAYYADAVRWATQNGITGGYSNGLFGPDDPVTNEQLCAFFHRYAKLAGIAGTAQPGVLGGFADWQQISDYAQESFGWAVDAGILFGDSQRRLAPQSQATRAQTAAIVMRFCQSVI